LFVCLFVCLFVILDGRLQLEALGALLSLNVTTANWC
jgi:hypothetical protein